VGTKMVRVVISQVIILVMLLVSKEGWLVIGHLVDKPIADGQLADKLHQ